ncbi:glycoside hydrolase family 79 protein [Hysterangium stoloniferum]|nr:glycoside hydrolase family 79 protein [Hysterangium stoloniferum]
MQVVLSLLSLYFAASPVYASVTIYTQVPLGTATGSSISPAGTDTTHAAFDPTVLNPPALPSPPIPTTYVLQLTSGGANNLSIQQPGNFLGFSVELSVADQICTFFSTHIQPVLLNLLANVERRAGSVQLRVGGNTQEKAVFFPEGLPGEATILKDKSQITNPTQTPTIQVGIDLLYAMSNITSLVNAVWYMGVPFNDSANPRLAIAQYSERILGTSLKGLQVGNEPDLYADHGVRPQPYGPPEYVAEFGTMLGIIGNDSNIINKTNIIAPSTCCNYGVNEVLAAGFQQFIPQLGYLAVEQWVILHVFELSLGNVTVDLQSEFPKYLSHAAVVAMVQPFVNVANQAVAFQKPLLMTETNTASCGGFPGISDTFGAGLWGIDYALQLAYGNFSGAMMHMGGQNVYYNPFTPPPTNDAKHGKQWTIGPIYYSTLIVAEVLGSSNTSQVVDLFANGNTDSTPAYAIYENGTPVRVALFNYNTDPSGATNYTAQIAIGGSGVNQPNASPSQVTVRYFTAPSVSTKTNLLWANQTFGGVMESDGTFQGTQETVTIQCDTTNNICPVNVPAPGFALVFLTPEAQAASSGGQAAVVTFATTATTGIYRNTATIPPGVLATSNGHGGLNNQVGSTSFGSTNGALNLLHALPGILSLLCMAIGAAMIGRSLVQ